MTRGEGRGRDKRGDAEAEGSGVIAIQKSNIKIKFTIQNAKTEQTQMSKLLRFVLWILGFGI